MKIIAFYKIFAWDFLNETLSFWISVRPGENLFASLMQLSLNSMEKSRFLAEGEPSKLSESFLVAGVTFLDKLT